MAFLSRKGLSIARNLLKMYHKHWHCHWKSFRQSESGIRVAINFCS